jgi:hypothetical protein
VLQSLDSQLRPFVYSLIAVDGALFSQLVWHAVPPPQPYTQLTSAPQDESLEQVCQ